MKIFYKLLILSLFLMLPMISMVIAHSPINEGGDSLENALEIQDPTKSWAIYSELEEEDEVKYYKFKINKGEQIYISLHTPPSVDDQFKPRLLLFGPGLSDNESVPGRIETPDESGVKSLGYFKKINKFYEPFTPSVLYEFGEIDIDAPETGTYYITVYSDEKAGPFGFAIGKRESFTPEEIFLLPIRINQIYQWEGQSLFIIFLPLLISYIAGVLIMLMKRENFGVPEKPVDYVLIVAAFTLFGTAAITGYQLVLKGVIIYPSWESILSLIWVIIPLFFGISIIRTVYKKDPITATTRIKFIIFGLISITIWTGFYIGPFALFVAALLPNKTKSSDKLNF